MISMDPVVWIGAFFTLAVISYVYKYNRLFRFAEISGIAVTMGWIVVGAIKTILELGINPLPRGQFLNIVPIVLGILLFTRFSKSRVHMSRLGASIVIGVGMGLAMRGSIETQIVGQIIAMNIPLVGSVITFFNNFMILLLVVAGFMYFYFSAPQRGPFGRGVTLLGRIGRYGLMTAFGAQYGSMVMARMSLLIARLDFLWTTWLHF
jgi:hypothetical protein